MDTTQFDDLLDVEVAPRGEGQKLLAKAWQVSSISWSRRDCARSEHLPFSWRQTRGEGEDRGQARKRSEKESQEKQKEVIAKKKKKNVHPFFFFPIQNFRHGFYLQKNTSQTLKKPGKIKKKIGKSQQFSKKIDKNRYGILTMKIDKLWCGLVRSDKYR